VGENYQQFDKNQTKESWANKFESAFIFLSDGTKMGSLITKQAVGSHKLVIFYYAMPYAHSVYRRWLMWKRGVLEWVTFPKPDPIHFLGNGSLASRQECGFIDVIDYLLILQMKSSLEN